MVSGKLRWRRWLQFAAWMVAALVAVLALEMGSVLGASSHRAIAHQSELTSRTTAIDAQPADPRVQDAEQWLDAGRDRLHSGDLTAAADAYQQALLIYTKLIEPFCNGELFDSSEWPFAPTGGLSCQDLQSNQSHNLSRLLIGRARALSGLGEVALNQGDYSSALDDLKSALNQFQTWGDRPREGETYNLLGWVYRQMGQYEQSFHHHHQALELATELDHPALEAEARHGLGTLYNNVGEVHQALTFYEQALELRRVTGDRRGESRTLNNLGGLYLQMGDYETAREVYLQALSIRQDEGDRLGEGRILNNLGNLAQRQGNLDEALVYHQQALEQFQATGDRASEGITVNNLGALYERRSDYDQAQQAYQQALTIAEDLGDRPGIGIGLDNLGGIAYRLGNYAQAQAYYQQALGIHWQVGQRLREGHTLLNLAGVHIELGRYRQGLYMAQQALAIYQEIEHPVGEVEAWLAIGHIQEHLDDAQPVLSTYQRAFAIAKQIGDRPLEARALNQIGGVYWRQQALSKARDAYQTSLDIQPITGDRAHTLNNLALVYADRGQMSEAIAYLQQALQIFQTTGDRAAERIVFRNLGILAERRNEPELAVVFYKSAVDISETLRAGLHSLTQAEQQSYLDSVADTYRHLAALLLDQNRILEAQQVLELLKREEVEDFTHTRTQPGSVQINLLPYEAALLDDYTSLVAFGQELHTCEQTQCAQLSHLRDRRDQLTRQFQQTVHTLEDEIRALRAIDDSFLDPRNLSREAQTILAAQPQSVLIYPLVLDDRTWLLWATPGRVVSSRELVNVGRRQIGAEVLKFRQRVQDPRSRLAAVNAIGQQLYEWLVAPILNDLEASDIQHLIFALDRTTRYIPMAALFDGEQYLIERYTINTILSAELTRMGDRLPPGTENTSILAAGVSEAVADFSPLPNVETELDAIVRESDRQDNRGIYPGLKLLNQSFDFRTLRDNASGRRILHIATHGAFVPGHRDLSYLLMGSGEKLPIQDIEILADYLDDIHLVVLSACETALGGPDLNGVEIAGISYYFLNSGAEAIVASLWQVDDLSTSLLMQSFYHRLAASTHDTPIAKVEALQQAQLGLLHGTDLDESIPERSYVHPYYWAPFILIGNGR